MRPRTTAKNGRTFARAMVVGLAVIGAATIFFVARSRSDATAAPATLHAACRADSACTSPLVCRYAEGNTCGAAGAPGACGWPFDGCDAKSPQVCGCNGVTYANQCAAHRAGTSIGYRGACVTCRGGARCGDLAASGKRTPTFCRAADDLCVPRPSACAAGGPATCGKDGLPYENDCTARRAGTDVDHAGGCLGERERARDAAPASLAPGGLAFGSPEEQGMSVAPLLRLADWIEGEHLPIFSLLVSKNGMLVYELYTSSLTREHAHYLMGATAVLTSALMGVAIDRHLVASPETSVADALPAALFPSPAARERFRAVTIRDLLAMSALDAPLPPRDKSETAQERQRQFMASPNRARFALTQAVVSEPGTTCVFTDVTPTLAAAIIEYAAKTTALELAEEAFFRPMDFRNYEWTGQDQAGIDNGSYGLRLRPVDMQKLGILTLREGSWEGKQLASADWVLRSLSPWMKGSPEAAAPNYGAYWWATDYGDPARNRRGWGAHLATGWKGQRIAIMTEQGVVVTMTGVIEPPEDEVAIFRRVIQDFVIPSVMAAPEPEPSSPATLRERLERVRVAPAPWKNGIENRMVPSIEPKGSHHHFQP